MSNKGVLGLSGVFNIYTVKRNFLSVISFLLLGLSLSASFWLYFTKDLAFIYSFLGKVIAVFLGSIPDLLGFCIGGYAIIIAMNSLDKMQAVIKPMAENNNMSYYQIISADFAMTLVMMCSLLMASYALNLAMELEFSSINESFGKIVDLVLISLLLWVGLLVIRMLIDTVINLFNTSIILQAVAIIAGDNQVEEGDDSNAEFSIYKVDTLFGHFTVTKFSSRK